MGIWMRKLWVWLLDERGCSNPRLARYSLATTCNQVSWPGCEATRSATCPLALIGLDRCVSPWTDQLTPCCSLPGPADSYEGPAILETTLIKWRAVTLMLFLLHYYWLLRLRQVLCVWYRQLVTSVDIAPSHNIYGHKYSVYFIADSSFHFLFHLLQEDIRAHGKTNLSELCITKRKGASQVR